MAERMQWFRMYAEFYGNPVVQSLAFEDQRHFVVLLCMKCDGTIDRPTQPQVRDRIICRGLGLDPVSAAEAKRRLAEVGLIDSEWQPTGWCKRQFVSDISTERVRKYRKKKETGNVTETPPKRFGNAPETETETETETERSEAVSKGGVGGNSQAEGRASRSRGTRLLLTIIPDDWFAWARTARPDLDINQAWDTFRDYWTAQPGQKGVKTDWMATWRNWVRREDNAKVKSNATNRSTPGQRFRAAAEASLAEHWDDPDPPGFRRA